MRFRFWGGRNLSTSEMNELFVLFRCLPFLDLSKDGWNCFLFCLYRRRVWRVARRNSQNLLIACRCVSLRCKKRQWRRQWRSLRNSVMFDGKWSVAIDSSSCAMWSFRVEKSSAAKYLWLIRIRQHRIYLISDHSEELTTLTVFVFALWSAVFPL